MNRPQILLSFITSTWFAGFLTNALRTPTIRGQLASVLGLTAANMDLLRWTIAAVGLCAYGAAVLLVPDAYDKLEFYVTWPQVAKNQPDFRMPQPQDVTRGTTLANLIILCTLMLIGLLPILTVPLGGISNQERFITVAVPAIIIISRHWKYVRSTRRTVVLSERTNTI